LLGFVPFGFGSARIDNGNDGLVIIAAGFAGAIGFFPAAVMWVISRIATVRFHH
jgi:hypothetical protein